MCTQRMLLEIKVLKMQATWGTVHKVRPSVITVNGTCTLYDATVFIPCCTLYLFKAMIEHGQKYAEHSMASKTSHWRNDSYYLLLDTNSNNWPQFHPLFPLPSMLGYDTKFRQHSLGTTTTSSHVTHHMNPWSWRKRKSSRSSIRMAYSHGRSPITSLFLLSYKNLQFK